MARGERGFTIIEMLVSVLILAVVALGSASLLSVTLHQNKLAQKRSIATSLAAERIEQLTSERWRAAADYQDYVLAGETASAGPPPTLTANYGSIPGHPDYRRVLTLNYNVPVPGMLQVVSEVAWTDLTQGEKRHTLITYVHPGLEQGQ